MTQRTPGERNRPALDYAAAPVRLTSPGRVAVAVGTTTVSACVTFVVVVLTMLWWRSMAILLIAGYGAQVAGVQLLVLLPLVLWASHRQQTRMAPVMKWACVVLPLMTATCVALVWRRL